MGRDVRNSLTFYPCLAHDDIIMVSVCGGWDVILYKCYLHPHRGLFSDVLH